MLLLFPVGEVAVALLLAPLLSPNGAGAGAGAGVGVGVGVAAGAEAVALVVGEAPDEAVALPLLEVAPGV
ncbi:hypothetical protein [Microcoleus sp. BR0-C5]|uniref:hypothetical protein n=1 Tax=Microcoleus sp. BR0-C5 TaxID=2818713 RepID=UPI002FD2B085